MSHAKRAGVSQGVEALLGVVSVGLVAIAWQLPQDSEVRTLIGWYDLGFCAFFFANFVTRLLHAEKKKAYLLPWGLLDLLSAIPAVDSLRFARVFRVVRVYRVLSAAHSLRRMFRASPREATFAIAGGAIACALIGLTLLVLHFELQHPEGLIHTAQDALWWSVVTISTVGYGDLYPITLGGRICATALMFVGIGTFGLIAGAFADLMVRLNRIQSEESR